MHQHSVGSRPGGGRRDRRADLRRARRRGSSPSAGSRSSFRLQPCVQQLSPRPRRDCPDVVVPLVNELADLGQRVAMAVVEDDHDTLAVRQLLHEVADPGVAGGRGRGEARQHAISGRGTVDPVAAGHADALEPCLDGGRVPKLAECLETEDVGVLDGVLGRLRIEERPSERQEACWQPSKATSYRSRSGRAASAPWSVVSRDACRTHRRKPRRIGRHGAGTMR